ncbi:MAG: VOC family protein [Planctomycetota bacterium]
MSESDYQLVLLKIPVSDVDRAAAFYRDALGFEERFVAAEYGWAQLQAGAVPLGLYKPGMGGGEGPIGGSLDFHLGLFPASFDPLAQRLKEQGLLVENMIHRGDDGSTFFEVSDPDGNRLKAMRLPSEAP